jgi:arylsulfatase A-like enzyme
LYYSKDFNILAINLDGLRRDKLFHCPALKSLSERSYYFSKMDTVTPYTFTSLHAIFSGLYPSSNGVNAYYNMFKFKKNSLTTIPQFLKKLGYYTCCDVNSKSVMPEQGYDEYLVYDEQTIDFPQRHSDLIKKLHKKKFFIFLQNTETHNNLVRAIIERDKEKSSDNEYFNTVEENDLVYNSHLPATDSYVDILLNTLDELGISKKTILVIFSDHGTSVGEKKGEKFYGVYVYDYTLNVFTIIHIPGQAPKKIDKQCRTIDIFPTIAEIVGAQNEQSSKIHGESLFSFIENPNAEDREVFAETGGLYGPWPSPKKHNVFCVKINQKKLIYNDTPKTWEFYDLKNDSKELNNLYNENSEEVKFLKGRLIHYFQENNIITSISSND